MKRNTIQFLGLLLAMLLALSLLPLGALSALAEPPDETIASAGLTLSLPAAGPTGVEAGQPVPAAAGVASGSGFTVSEAWWYDASGISPESFEAGQAYFSSIVLVPAEGFVFAESTAVEIDSLAVKSVQLREDGSLLVTTENYTVAGESVQYYNVWVGGVQVSSANRDDILGDGGKAKYDPASGTLTLNKPALTGVHEASGSLIAADGVDLIVEGSADVGTSDAFSFFSVREGDLTLKGDFSGTFSGFSVLCGKKLTVDSGRLKVESTNPDGTGIWVEGDLLVNTAQVTVTATGCGIHVKGNFTLEEGVIKATATGEDCDSETMKHGILTDGTMTIKGGDITAKAPTAGLYSSKGITVSGGIILAQGGEIGIFVGPEGALDLQNGTRRVTADGQGSHGAIYAPQITLGSDLQVKEPAGGKVGNDKQHITLKDGTHISKHALIESSNLNFTVSFETFGGSTVPSQEVPSGATAQKPEDPVLEGFTFKGWYEDAAAQGKPFDFSTPIQADLTLEALWVCTVNGSVKDTAGNAGAGGLVSFEGGEYQPSVSVELRREGGPYSVACKPANGYVFDHWEDGEGNTLSETDASFSFSVQDGSKSFVAVFRQQGHTITFDGCGGEPAIQTLVTGDNGKLDAAELSAVCGKLTREGHDLIGWSRTPDGEPFGVGDTVFDDDATVYAVWKIRTYTVTFKGNGGTATPSQKVVHNGTVKEPDDPVRKGYSFDGWYSDKGLTQPFDFDSPVTSNLVLYAKWDRVVKYTVVSGGGSIYGKTSGKDLVITVRRTPKDAECFQHFTGVKIDGGDLIQGTDYTAEPGGTIVTLKASCLSKLNSGTHIITITFDDGKATTGLTVKAGTGGGGSRRGSGGGRGDDNPETGDPGNPLFWGGLMVFSGLGLGAAVLSGRKLRRASRS